jgi:pilus assembly protein FimV
MYAARKDVSAFEAIAGELYTTLGADDPTWAKVAELGITVEPDNPLYDISQIVPVAILASAATSNRDSNDADMDIGNDLNFSLDKPDAIAETDSSMDLDSATSNQVDFEQVNFNQDGFEKNASDLGELNSDFASNKAEDTTLAESAEDSLTNNLDKNSVADNAMSFDFPDLGSFALSSDEPVGVDKTSSTDEQANQQSAAAVDLADLPASEQIEFTTTTTADESDALNGLDFNFNTEPVTGEQTSQAPDTTLASSDFNFEGFTDAVTPAEAEKVESSAIEAVDFNFEGFGETSAEVNIDNKPQENSFEGISLDFETEETSSTLNIDNVHEEKVNEDNKSDEISFDFPLTDEQATNASEMQVGELSQAEANNFDFSTINLDLTDGPAQADDGLSLSEPSLEISDMAVPELVATDVVENENPDIDIKLDLVKVYIDMEDIEGARDLLDEVLKEGGPQQRATAEKLLVSLA